MAPDELDAIGRALIRLEAVGPLLDIGSRDVNGTIRPLLPPVTRLPPIWHYVGVDWDTGPNVDVRASGHDLPFADATFSTVVCNSTLEHDPFFFRTIGEMYRVAQVCAGAILIIGIPTLGFPYHAHPVDCYRPTHDAFSNFLLAGCDAIVIERVATDGPPRLCGSGRVRKDWQQALLDASRRVPIPYEAPA